MAPRIGIDENGLGARLGPMIVTGVIAHVNEAGERLLRRKLAPRLRQDLDDSKRLVSTHDYALGEAWARAIVETTTGAAPARPEELFEALSLEGSAELKSPCPKSAKRQCWHTASEDFTADATAVQRIKKHLAFLRKRGVELAGVRSSVLCVRTMNDLRERGVNRFVADLHAMERIVVRLRHDHAPHEDIHAVCGKVGGIAEYSKFFGPLAGQLHNVLEEGRAQSSYRFPGLGELHFVRDADASDPLVMMASLVGKYVRELTMGRITDSYALELGEAHRSPSGYHDPVTARFVEQTEELRRRRQIPLGCFERAGALGITPSSKTSPRSTNGATRTRPARPSS